MRTPMSDRARRQLAAAEWQEMYRSAYAQWQGGRGGEEYAQWHGGGGGGWSLPVEWLYSDAFGGGGGGLGGRVRVGYLSFNFSPTRNLNGLVSGLLQCHDRTRFHVTSFAIYGHHHRDSEEVFVLFFLILCTSKASKLSTAAAARSS